MKVVVFGGSGFLGSHLVESLINKGHKVTVFDKNRSSNLNKTKNFIQGDILDIDAVNNAIKHNEIVYHMAGIADIDECNKNPLETIKNNIIGTVNILKSCVDNKVKKILFASTIYVYSKAGSFYRASKQSCELLVEAYQKEYGLDYVILRYGSLYGPGSNMNNSIYRFLHQAISKKKILYKGTGQETREFIHVIDAAELSVKVMDDSFNNQNIILTGNESTKYKDLLEMIKEIMGNKIEISYEENKSNVHYKLSPYSFNPKPGKKLVNNPHIDLGQGLVNLTESVQADIDKQKT